MVLDLVPATDPILREVIPEGHVPLSVIENLQDTMRHHGALGLAAPQVGLRYRCFVTHFGLVFINPRYVRKSRELEAEVESCLSLPGISVLVPRHVSVKIQTHQHTLIGSMARIVQHEMDHLNGILITYHGQARLQV